MFIALILDGNEMSVDVPLKERWASTGYKVQCFIGPALHVLGIRFWILKCSLEGRQHFNLGNGLRTK
jgi:hypothetical protein